MDEFQELTKDNIPDPDTLVLCRRINGHLYIAIRKDKPLSTKVNEPWADCHWWGNAENSENRFNMSDSPNFSSNFSDVTVASWKYVGLKQ